MITNGFYKVTYGGATGSGFGMLAFFNGAIVGLDEAGVRYDGEYGEDDMTGAVQMHMTVTVPENVALVVGTPARGEAWSFAVDAVLPPGFAGGAPTKLRTRFGVVTVAFTLLRGIDPPKPDIVT
ncbi:MAG TPA: hypothetical protein VN802_07385 [Stellaceae bacterium]|nr:hypothetical protein [Stellaceae bacterium]